MKISKKWKSKLEYLGFMILYKFLRIFPYSFIEFFLENLLIFGGLVLKIRKDVALTQLNKSFPEKTEREINSILKNVYRNIGKMTAETFFGDDKKLFNKITTNGFENLHEALSLGRGMILVSAHFGNWELAGRYIASTGINTGIVIKKQRNPYFETFSNKPREKFGIKIIHKKRSLKEILKFIKTKGMVVLVSDQNAGSDGIKFKFLGRDASIHTGAAKFGVKFGIPIVIGMTVRTKENKHILYFEKPIYTDQIEKTSFNIEQLAMTISERIEKYVEKYPDQWFWVHKRWKGAKKAKEPQKSV